ncbi:hypothetical protein [Xanthomonas sp. SI]|uniref:hypothetical protein n=1 Tax=Xanthomonas sp. SI TaxID=2724123 RepID=UPI00163AADCF|nr:hypothetical protein [Xanthomonas sp. SI]QNH12678.1 hypothetical protein HEP75_02116 [Xanthomonas sp. SI]
MSKGSLSGPFGEGKDWALNASIGEHPFVPDELAYIWGYEAAVGALTAAARHVARGGEQPCPGTDIMVDAVIYPQVFCARHYVELSLKRMIRRVGVIGKAKITAPGTHELTKLLEILVDRANQFAPDLVPYIQEIRPMICELAKVDADGDAFRYAATKGDVMHPNMPKIVNIDTFQSWFDENRRYINDLLFIVGFELDELEIGGGTKFYSRQALAELADRLPLNSVWNKEILDVIHRKEMEALPQLTKRQFDLALSVIKSKPWLSIKVGIEVPLPEVKSDLFQRLMVKDGGAGIVSLEEWGALYWIYKIGAGLDPEEYSSGMAVAKVTAAKFEEWCEAERIRRSSMSIAEMEADEAKRFDDVERNFDCSGMGCYWSEGMIRSNLKIRAYIICQGLDRLGQPTLLCEFQRACDYVGIGYAVPSAGRNRESFLKASQCAPSK